MSVTIRMARSGEGRRSVALWQQWLDGIDFDEQMAGVDGRGPAKDMGLRLYLAEIDRTTVGLVLIGPPIRLLVHRHGMNLTAIRADPAFRGVAKLRGVAVDPAVRGQGIGSALVNRAIGATQTPTWIYGQCDDAEQLRAFYDHLGFTVLPRGHVLKGPFDLNLGIAGQRECWFTQEHTR